MADRLAVWDELRDRGYDPSDTQALLRRLKNARNVATHGADAVLIDLGFPAGRDRPPRTRRETQAHELSLAGIQADLAGLLHAVGLVLDKLFRLMSDSGFDDMQFDAQFAT